MADEHLTSAPDEANYREVIYLNKLADVLFEEEVAPILN